mgnify:CR=1 FL=1
MRLLTKMVLGHGIIRSRFTGRKIPLLVGWSLTNRCNIRCKYCNIPRIKEKELDTDNILDIIEQLGSLGCKRINFTGGEPFLRDDLPDIVRNSKERGIFTGATSNGLLAAKNPETVELLDLLILSLDGPKKIQDKYRGKGTYGAVFDLLESLPPEKLMISSVLYKQNLKHIDFLLETAKYYGARGAVIDGGARDTEYMYRLRLPVFARYTTPNDILHRWEMVDYNVPITIGGVSVAPGDYILGDRDGVVVIPQEIAGEVISKAEEVVRTENLVRKAILEGVHPVEAYQRYGRF